MVRAAPAFWARLDPGLGLELQRAIALETGTLIATPPGNTPSLMRKAVGTHASLTLFADYAGTITRNSNQHSVRLGAAGRF